MAFGNGDFDEMDNGLLVTADSTNFFQEASWEFATSVLHKFSTELEHIYDEFVNECPADSFFKKNTVKIVIQKYGQNVRLNRETVNSLAEELTAFFDIAKCRFVKFAFADNYKFRHKDVKTTPFFEKSKIDNIFEKSLHFYGKMFNNNVGNFQTSKSCKVLDNLVQDFNVLLEEDHDAFTDMEGFSAAFDVNAVQGYNSSKQYIRKRAMEQPFIKFPYTSMFSKNYSNLTVVQTKTLEEDLETFKHFEELRGRLEVLAKENSMLRIEYVYKFDLELLESVETFGRLFQLAFELHDLFGRRMYSILKDSIIILPSEEYFGTHYILLCLWEEEIKNYLILYKSLGFLFIFDLEMVNLIEKFITFQFSGDAKYLPSTSMTILKIRKHLKNGFISLEKDFVRNIVTTMYAGNGEVMMELNQLKLDFSLYLQKMESNIYLSCQHSFIKNHTAVKKENFLKLVKIEEIIYQLTIQQDTNDQTSLVKQLVKIFLKEIFPVDVLKAFKRRYKRNLLNLSDQEKQLFIEKINTISAIDEIKQISEISVMFVQKFAKINLEAKDYFDKLVDYILNTKIEKYKYTITSRMTYCFNYLIDHANVPVELLKRSFVTFAKNNNLLFMPQVTSTGLAETQFCQIFYQTNQVDIIPFGFPLGQQRLYSLHKLPGFDEAMGMLQSRADLDYSIFDEFEPGNNYQDAVILIKAITSSVEPRVSEKGAYVTKKGLTNTISKRARYILLYVLLYLASKLNKQGIVKLFRDKGLFWNYRVNVTLLVDHGVLEGEKIRNSYRDIKPKLQNDLNHLRMAIKHLRQALQRHKNNTE